MAPVGCPRCRSWLEPRKGEWHFETLDRYVELAERRGVGLLLPLGLSPAWASSRPFEKSIYGPGNAAEPKDIKDWRTYVKAIATRYKGRIRDYEIWNEPNLKRFWAGDVGHMVDLTREASAVIHGIDPGSTVVSPSATNADGSDGFGDERFDGVFHVFHIHLRNADPL
jgi:hypothetical protein